MHSLKKVIRNSKEVAGVGMEKIRGYFGIGIENPRKEKNIGSLYRSAYTMGASYIFGIKNNMNEVLKQKSDTTRAWKHIPFYHYKNIEDFLDRGVPYGCKLVGVEILPEAVDITTFIHPERVCYILGPENGGLSKEIVNNCSSIIKIPSKHCLNVAVAGSIVLYDRLLKQKK